VAVLCGSEGNRGSGVAPAMRQHHSAGSTALEMSIVTTVRSG